MDNINIDLLADLVMAKILEKYGDISPLTLLANEEELMVSELARLNTILAMLEEKEEYRKAAIIMNKIKRIENKLNGK
tara:strand:+ start:61 stop:294 length:234 start_codon:yes stop_codon:yes gene_type:complete